MTTEEILKALAVGFSLIAAAFLLAFAVPFFQRIGAVLGDLFSTTEFDEDINFSAETEAYATKEEAIKALFRDYGEIEWAAVELLEHKQPLGFPLYSARARWS